MAYEKRSRIEEEKLQDREATPKTPTLKENIVLSVKLLIGDGTDSAGVVFG